MLKEKMFELLKNPIFEKWWFWIFIVPICLGIIIGIPTSLYQNVENEKAKEISGQKAKEIKQKWMDKKPTPKEFLTWRLGVSFIESTIKSWDYVGNVLKVEINKPDKPHFKHYYSLRKIQKMLIHEPFRLFYYIEDLKEIHLVIDVNDEHIYKLNITKSEMLDFLDVKLVDILEFRPDGYPIIGKKCLKAVIDNYIDNDITQTEFVDKYVNITNKGNK